MLPPNYCPVELTTAYEKRPSIFELWTESYVGVWQHTPNKANEDWIAKIPIDSTFMANYTTEWDNGIFVYDAEIDNAGDGQWGVYIYNFSDQVWETLVSASDVTSAGGHIPTGWNQVETFNLNDHPSLPLIGSTDCEIWDGGSTWTSYHTLTDDYSSVDASASFPYIVTNKIPNWYWWMNCAGWWMCE